MAQKFFLFKRSDPSIQGGTVFSDSGKGISVISLPTQNLAYMAADRGSITLYFNDSAPFEENSLTLAGESFEKTSITVTCEVGKEIELMENIIGFINRKTQTDVMKFDSISNSNTFASITPSPLIDTRVRARPVERGFAGGDAVVTGLDANAVVNGIDFIRVDNKPFIDFDANILTGLSSGELITSWTNSGTGGSNYNFSVNDNVFDAAPTLSAPDEACVTASAGFDGYESSLKIQVDFSNNGAASHVVTPIPPPASGSPLDPNLSDEYSTAVLVLDTFGSLVTLEGDSRFIVSTDGSGNITDFRCVQSSLLWEAGYVASVLFGISGVKGGLQYTVQSNELATEVESATVNFINGNGAPDSPFPILDYVIYCVVIIPEGALAQPIYACQPHERNTYNLFRTYVDQMGPFTLDSKGVEFEVNHGQPKSGTFFGLSNQTYVDSIQSYPFESTSNTFSFRSQKGSRVSVNDLHVYIIRRDAAKNIYIYSRDGELIARRPPNENDEDTKLVISQFGMVLPFDVLGPKMRIARFGLIKKDLGDLQCRNLADQLYNKYKP